MFVPTLVTVTVTPGINAPDASATVPPTVAFDVPWPKPVQGHEQAQERSQNVRRLSSCSPLSLSFLDDLLVIPRPGQSISRNLNGSRIRKDKEVKNADDENALLSCGKLVPVFEPTLCL
jgi:hypothetical protein